MNKYQGMINLANKFLKTPISTDAELSQSLAFGSGEDFAKIINGLAPSIDKKVVDTLNATPNFTANLLVNSTAMGELVSLIENNLGGVEDYNVDLRYKQDNTTSDVLSYTYRTNYKKKATTTLIQNEFKQAFINGSTFPQWLAQKIARGIIIPMTRWNESVVQKDILSKFKNEQDLTISVDYDPTKAGVVIETMTNLLQFLTFGRTPSVLGEIGYDKGTLTTENAKYDATTDVYQATFDKKKHLVNTFDTTDLTLIVSPKNKIAFNQALANIYHMDQLKIDSQVIKIAVGNQVKDTEIYCVANGTIRLEKVLDEQRTQDFAQNMGTDIVRHMWLRLGVIPWGIGFKLNVGKPTTPQHDQASQNK